MTGTSKRALAEANHCATSRELAMRFAIWAVMQRDVPTPERIADRFGVCYATAYRWRNDFCAASGREVPPRRAYGETAWPSQCRKKPSPAATGTTATPIQGPRNDP